MLKSNGVSVTMDLRAVPCRETSCCYDSVLYLIVFWRLICQCNASAFGYFNGAAHLTFCCQFVMLNIFNLQNYCVWFYNMVLGMPSLPLTYQQTKETGWEKRTKNCGCLKMLVKSMSLYLICSNTLQNVQKRLNSETVATMTLSFATHSKSWGPVLWQEFQNAAYFLTFWFTYSVWGVFF